MYTRPQLGCSCRDGGGRAMGDATFTVTDPVSQLVTQVNRFGPGAPQAYQFTATAFPLSTGVVPPDVALVALTIYQRRATDGYAQFHDTGSLSAVAAANAGFADPVGFITGHLADVTATIGAFADSLGLPGGTGLLAGIDTNTLLLCAAAGAVLWWLVK